MPPERGRGPRPLLVVLAVAGIVAAVVSAGRRHFDAVEVRGHSMAPTLLPGDRLLVESRTFARRPPVVGDVVLAADPREPDRELVKRVAAVQDGSVELRGDDPSASSDSRVFGTVPMAAVRWRAVCCYWPRDRWRRL